MLLSVIVPAFNEAATIEKTLTDFLSFLSKQNYDFEIIVVNDCSTDDTKNELADLAKEQNKIKILDNEFNLGKGASVRKGLLAAAGDYALFTDADNASSIDHLITAWPFIEKKYDIIIGTRSKKDAAEARQEVPQASWKRNWGSLGNYIIRNLLVKNIWDTQCGFKIFSQDAVKKIIAQTKTNRWALDVEILALAQRHNCQIAIIPIRWVNRADSRVKIKGYFIMLGEILKIKYNLLANKYQLK